MPKNHTSATASENRERRHCASPDSRSTDSASTDSAPRRGEGANQLFEEAGFQEFRCFRLAILQTDAASLIGNPLGDSTRRRHGVLIPKKTAPVDGWPVVFILAGFTGNGPNYFNLKTFELNVPQQLDASTHRNEAPLAVYVFIEAMTYWGGSQFINSAATGRYEDFVLDDVVPAVREILPVARDEKKWCVMGGSSGGYGALHLSSAAPKLFGLAAAIAPDCFFEASLLPEFWAAAPTIVKLGGLRGVREELESGRLQRRKDWHSVLNAVAMALCYSGSSFDSMLDDTDGSTRESAALFPIDMKLGILNEERFAKLKAYDPIVFLKDREMNVRELRGIFLDVGTRDQFNLQYGARQIRDVLKQISVSLKYSEFEGNHFDIGDRRPEVWRWLLSQDGWNAV